MAKRQPKTATAIADWAEQQTQPAQPLVAVNRGGRPTILTDALITEAAQLLREGHYVEAVANALRIGKSSFYRWLERGQADDGAGHTDTLHARFWDAVKEAEGWAEIENGREWRAGGQFWAKNATWAERRYPDRWGKRDSDGNAGPKVVIQIGAGAADVKVGVLVSPPRQPALGEGQQNS